MFHSPANQFKINVVFTGSQHPLYTYGDIQAKLVNFDGMTESFSLTRYYSQVIPIHRAKYKIWSDPICFSTDDELLTSGAKLEKLIVAHPALEFPVEVQITYTAYQGWIYSGQ